MAWNERSFLIIANSLCIVFSTCFTFIGIWILNDDKALEKLHMGILSEEREYYGTVATVIGTISIVVYSIGLWGAYKGITIMLKVYAGILILNVVLTFFNSIFLLMALDPKPIAKLEPLFTNSTQDPHILAEMHTLQKNFECCGFKGPKDVHTSRGYPWSCCGTDEKVICSVPTHKDGCFTQMKKKLTNTVVSKVAGAFVGSVIQGVFIFAALRLAPKVAKNPATPTVYMQFT